MLIIKFPESHSIRPVEKGFIFMYNNCLQEQKRDLWAITLIWLVRCHLFLEIDTFLHLKISALKMLHLISLTHVKIICISYQYVFFFITLIPTPNERQFPSFETNLHFLYTCFVSSWNWPFDYFGEEFEKFTDRQPDELTDRAVQWGIRKTH